MTNTTKFGYGDPETCGKSVHDELDADGQLEREQMEAESEAEELASYLVNDDPAPWDDPEFVQAVINIVESSDEENIARWIATAMQADTDLKPRLEDLLCGIIYGKIMRGD